jgi:hypothetical protein
LSPAEGIKGDVEGEKLYETGRGHPYLRILFKENRTGNGIHQDSGLGGDVEFWLSCLRKGCVDKNEKKSAQQQG